MAPNELIHVNELGKGDADRAMADTARFAHIYAIHVKIQMNILF